MSSIPALSLRERKEKATAVWGKEVSEYDIVAEIGGEGTPALRSPVFIDGENLEIDSGLLEVGRVYDFEYLGTNMVLWKLPSGAVDLFEIIEE